MKAADATEHAAIIVHALREIHTLARCNMRQSPPTPRTESYCMRRTDAAVVMSD